MSNNTRMMADAIAADCGNRPTRGGENFQRRPKDKNEIPTNVFRP